MVDGFHSQEFAEIAQELLDFVNRLAAEVRNLDLEHRLLRRRGRSDALRSMHLALEIFNGDFLSVRNAWDARSEAVREL